MWFDFASVLSDSNEIWSMMTLWLPKAETFTHFSLNYFGKFGQLAICESKCRAQLLGNILAKKHGKSR